MAHDFIALGSQPVQVLPDKDNQPVIFTDPDKPMEFTYGCSKCGVGIDEALHTPCIPVEEDAVA